MLFFLLFCLVLRFYDTLKETLSVLPLQAIVSPIFATVSKVCVRRSSFLSTMVLSLHLCLERPLTLKDYTLSDCVDSIFSEVPVERHFQYYETRARRRGIFIHASPSKWR